MRETWGWRQLSPRCRSGTAIGHGLQVESSWRADGPTEVLLLCHQGKSPSLGLSKNATFFLIPQPPRPLSREAGLQRHSISPRCIAGACTTLPDLSLLARLAGKPDFPQKCTQQWCQSGCKAKIWSMHGGQCCHGAVRGSHGARAEADISQVPASGWGPGCPRRRGTEHGGFGCVSFSWHWPWSILHIAPAPAGIKASSAK